MNYLYNLLIKFVFGPIYVLLLHNKIKCINSIFYRTIIKNSSNQSHCVYIKNSRLFKSKIIIEGINNKILINGCFLDNLMITIKGNDNHLIIEPESVIMNGTIWLEGNKNKIFLGKHFASKNDYLLNMGNENILKIGDDCMLGEDVDIWTSDSHPIYDINNINKPINCSKSIIIGNHVWIGKHARILKGVSIGNNAVIGMSSVITKNIPPNCIAVGCPAKITRDNITWSSKHIKI